MQKFCRCGHKKKVHWGYLKGEGKPNRCYFDGMRESDLAFIGEYEEKGCHCEGYVLDNLRYLEELYERYL